MRRPRSGNRGGSILSVLLSARARAACAGGAGPWPLRDGSIRRDPDALSRLPSVSRAPSPRAALYGMLGGEITRDDFVRELAAEFPETYGLVTELLADNGDALLLHPLMSDLLRLTVSSLADGRKDPTDRPCLREGDQDLVNAVGVSFVEDSGADVGESDQFLDRWPTRLRGELGR